MKIAEATLRIRSALVVIAHAGEIARIARRVVREAATLIYVQARIRLQQLAATRVVNPVATRSAPASEADKGATVPSPLLPGIPTGPASPHFSAPRQVVEVEGMRPHVREQGMRLGDHGPEIVDVITFHDGPREVNRASAAIYWLSKRQQIPS